MFENSYHARLTGISGYKHTTLFDTLTSKKIFKVPHKLFSVLNFELQASPFIDIALTRNRVANTIFKLQDGFYSGGIEVLIYPLKWKSFVVRTSLGFDLGKFFFEDKLNISWRDVSVSPYEIYFGLGLNY